MPRPSLAKVGRRDQLVYQAFVCLWRFVIQECRQFGRLGRQACQDERRAARQHISVRRRGHRDAGDCELGLDEPVDGIFRRAVGDLLFGNGLERPVLAHQLGVEAGISGRELYRLFLRPDHSLGDPLFEGGDLRGLQLAANGHSESLMADGLDQQALVRLTGNGSRTAGSAAQNPVAGVEAKTTELFFRPVTAVAFGRQDGPDLLFKEVGTLREYSNGEQSQS